MKDLRTNRDVNEDVLLNEVSKASKSLNDAFDRLATLEGIDFDSLMKDAIKGLKQNIKLIKSQNEHWSSLKDERMKSGEYTRYAESFVKYDDFCDRLYMVADNFQGNNDADAYYVDANCEIRAIYKEEDRHEFLETCGLKYCGDSLDSVKYFFPKSSCIHSIPTGTWEKYDKVIEILKGVN